MDSLERLRAQNDRRTRWAMGRLGGRPRALDSAVRADASLWDVLRLPPDVEFSGSLNNADGTLTFIAGLTELDEIGVI